MHLRIVRYAAALALTTSAALAAAQMPNIKTGGWNTTTKRRGTLPGLLLALQDAPPDVRARLEPAMRKAWEEPRTNSFKGCVTRADLADWAKHSGADDDCTYSNVKTSATSWEADAVCAEGRTGHFRVETPTPERIIGRMVMKVPTTKGPGTVNIEFDGRWASASCKGFDG
jgi:Protein of unknown function (DUF3617)